MKIGIMQPYFFPYLGYFQLIHAVDKFLLYPNVCYIRKGWMNRNRILVKWGSEMQIAVPVRKAALSSPISDMLIDTRRPAWRHKLLETLRHNYTQSEYFSETWPLIVETITADFPQLHAFNVNLITKIAAHLGLTAQIIAEGAGYLDIERRLASLPPAPEAPGAEPVECDPNRRTMRILAICKRESADCYVNPIGGVGLYDRAVFQRNGLTLYFVSSEEVVYRQFSQDFHPHLSIIDVLMHNGREKTKGLLSRYALI